MNFKVKIVIEFKNEKFSNFAYQSLNPDNIQIPSDLGLDMKVNKNKLIIILKSSNLKRIQSTSEEILRIINSIEKTLKVSS